MMILILIVVVLWFYYRNDMTRLVSDADKTAEQALKERFVRGEIDEETYLHMKEMIK